MATDFLAYWKPSTVEVQVAKGGSQDHAASNQYRRVLPGDTVWLVTIRQGRLWLVTRIVVARVTSQTGAAAILNESPDELWEATHHIVAAEGTAREIAERDIHHLASQLRFMSAGGNDRLTLDEDEDNAVNAQQFQTMRVLSPASAELLAGVFEASAEPGAAADGPRL